MLTIHSKLWRQHHHGSSNGLWISTSVSSASDRLALAIASQRRLIDETGHVLDSTKAGLKTVEAPDESLSKANNEVQTMHVRIATLTARHRELHDLVSSQNMTLAEIKTRIATVDDYETALSIRRSTRKSMDVVGPLMRCIDIGTFDATLVSAAASVVALLAMGKIMYQSGLFASPYKDALLMVLWTRYDDPRV